MNTVSFKSVEEAISRYEHANSEKSPLSDHAISTISKNITSLLAQQNKAVGSLEGDTKKWKDLCSKVKSLKDYRFGFWDAVLFMIGSGNFSYRGLQKNIDEISKKIKNNEAQIALAKKKMRQAERFSKGSLFSSPNAFKAATLYQEVIKSGASKSLQDRAKQGQQSLKFSKRETVKMIRFMQGQKKGISKGEQETLELLTSPDQLKEVRVPGNLKIRKTSSKTHADEDRRAAERVINRYYGISNDPEFTLKTRQFYTFLVDQVLNNSEETPALIVEYPK